MATVKHRRIADQFFFPDYLARCRIVQVVFYVANSYFLNFVLSSTGWAELKARNENSRQNNQEFIFDLLQNYDKLIIIFSKHLQIKMTEIKALSAMSLRKSIAFPV